MCLPYVSAVEMACCLQVAESCPQLRSMLAVQQQGAEARADAHWQEVQHKRGQLATLREQVQELEAKIPALEAQLREVQVRRAHMCTEQGEAWAGCLNSQCC